MKTNATPKRLTPRAFLKFAGLTTAFMVGAGGLAAWGQTAAGAQKTKETYETYVKGIRILPGQWRPHYGWEQIAWISPSWPSEDYLWLDFPEAIFSNQGLLFLSHVGPKFPVVFPDLPPMAWQEIARGLAFARHLPNGISFGGSLVRRSDTTVALELHIENGSRQPLTEIKLQTCLYMRGSKEFADFTNENKFVHLPELGWHQAGFSLVCNARHPCMHSDPQFPDLAPGEKASIQGEVIFFEGTLDEFSAFLKRRAETRG